jgi:hypothetical protein
MFFLITYFFLKFEVLNSMLCYEDIILKFLMNGQLMGNSFYYFKMTSLIYLLRYICLSFSSLTSNNNKRKIHESELAEEESLNKKARMLSIRT